MKAQVFRVELQTSNPNIEEVRTKLSEATSEWLDNVSFITGKDEICKSVKIID